MAWKAGNINKNKWIKDNLLEEKVIYWYVLLCFPHIEKRWVLIGYHKVEFRERVWEREEDNKDTARIHLIKAKDMVCSWFHDPLKKASS